MDHWPEHMTKPMLLFYDTETTGLINYKLPHYHPKQPNVVEYAGILSEHDGTERAIFHAIVRQDSRHPIPKEASDVHGISQQLSRERGMPLKMVWCVHETFSRLAGVTVCHNINFDQRIMRTMCYRANREAMWDGLPKKTYCTMEGAAPILKLPKTRSGGRGQYKPPKLIEACEFFFGKKERERFEEEAHGALADARMTKRVYFAIKDQSPTAAVPKGELL